VPQAHTGKTPRPGVERAETGLLKNDEEVGESTFEVRFTKHHHFYDANALRKKLRADGVKPMIPGRINRKRTIRYDAKRYKDRAGASKLPCAD
jgi:hypothetical protein